MCACKCPIAGGSSHSVWACFCLAGCSHARMRGKQDTSFQAYRLAPHLQALRTIVLQHMYFQCTGCPVFCRQHGGCASAVRQLFQSSMGAGTEYAKGQPALNSLASQGRVTAAQRGELRRACARAGPEGEEAGAGQPGQGGQAEADRREAGCAAGAAGARLVRGPGNLTFPSVWALVGCVAPLQVPWVKCWASR